MRGTGIDSDVEIYATKQSNEHQYTELKRFSQNFGSYNIQLVYLTTLSGTEQEMA
jgi:hypothetical protein